MSDGIWKAIRWSLNAATHPIWGFALCVMVGIIVAIHRAKETAEKRATPQIVKDWRVYWDSLSLREKEELIRYSVTARSEGNNTPLWYLQVGSSTGLAARKVRAEVGDGEIGPTIAFEIFPEADPGHPIKWLENAEQIASRSLIKGWEDDLRGDARMLDSEIVERQIWTVHYGD